MERIIKEGEARLRGLSSPNPDVVATTMLENLKERLPLAKGDQEREDIETLITICQTYLRDKNIGNFINLLRSSIYGN